MQSSRAGYVIQRALRRQPLPLCDQPGHHGQRNSGPQQLLPECAFPCASTCDGIRYRNPVGRENKNFGVSRFPHRTTLPMGMPDLPGEAAVMPPGSDAQITWGATRRDFLQPCLDDAARDASRACQTTGKVMNDLTGRPF